MTREGTDRAVVLPADLRPNDSGKRDFCGGIGVKFSALPNLLVCIHVSPKRQDAIHDMRTRVTHYTRTG